MKKTKLPPKPPTSILLVDDDRLVLSTLSSFLESSGYSVDTTESVDEAEAWLAQNDPPDLVLLDMSMPNRLGIELAPTLRALENIPFILLTAFSDKEVIEQAKQEGAISYLVKPVTAAELVPAIETALSRSGDLKNLQKSSTMLQTALDGDRAVSVAVGIVMNQHNLSHDDAFETIRRVARSNHLKLLNVAKEIINASQVLTLTSKFGKQETPK